MTVSDLKRLAALGEGMHLEFKRKVPRPERIAKEVIALANAEGGRVLLGVDDDGSVVGVRDALEEEFALRRALERHVHPRVDVELERVPITPRREVVVVDVPASRLKPHFLIEEPEANGQAARTAYVRVGASSVEASREAVRLMRHAAEPRDVRFEFGEKEQKLMRYLDRHERITVEGFARLAGVPRRSASQTLVLLARASVLRLHPDEREDYFTLAY